MRPVANLLQLCGGSRRPLLWVGGYDRTAVGGYDRTAWVLTMMLARARAPSFLVRPKSDLGGG